MDAITWSGEIRPIPLDKKNWLLYWTERGGAEHVGIIQMSAPAGCTTSTLGRSEQQIDRFLAGLVRRPHMQPALAGQ